MRLLHSVRNDRRGTLLAMTRAEARTRRLLHFVRNDNTKKFTRGKPGILLGMTKMVTKGLDSESDRKGWMVEPCLVKRLLARLAGLEPATRGLGNRCSILLSYRRIRAIIFSLSPDCNGMNAGFYEM